MGRSPVVVFFAELIAYVLVAIGLIAIEDKDFWTGILTDILSAVVIIWGAHAAGKKFYALKKHHVSEQTKQIQITAENLVGEDLNSFIPNTQQVRTDTVQTGPILPPTE